MKYPKVLDVKPIENYNIMIIYDNGEKKIFDVKPYISGNWYGKLKDIDFFKTVRPCGSTIEWADGQDIAPHELYDLSFSV